MDLSLLWRGVLIGLAIAAPVGPIGLLCIQRTLQDGRKFGFVSGLGAASADGIYGTIAGFGLTFISGFLVAQQTWLALIGGLFLCYLGVRTFLSEPAEKAVYAQRGGLLKAYAATFLLTLTNPITILSFIAIFAGLGLAAADRNYGEAISLVLGVFSGSVTWWLLLSGGVSLLRERFNDRAMQWVNRLAGLVIGGFGLFTLLSLLG
ncbi:MAG: LysE family translocator [Ardenticatenaceae bacterium]|nr:LysE family translocator [Ardenticatenaceae bacterium]MCB9443534.1 LysE family translocator [Ardenticatenaceae bacterium]